MDSGFFNAAGFVLSKHCDARQADGIIRALMRLIQETGEENPLGGIASERRIKRKTYRLQQVAALLCLRGCAAERSYLPLTCCVQGRRAGKVVVVDNSILLRSS